MTTIAASVYCGLKKTDWIEIHIQQTHILHITDTPTSRTLHSSIFMQRFMNPAGGFIYARIHDIRSHTKH